MNKSKQQTQQRPWMSNPSTWLIGVFLPLTAIMSGFLVREWFAKKQFERRLDELRQHGKPIDNASMELRFVTTTSAENTLAWNEAAYAASGWASIMGQDLAHFGANKNVPASAYIDGTWPEAQRVGEFLNQLNPVIQRIHEVADRTNGPVWQPIHFDGYSTLLGTIQESRSIGHLLALDFEYAVYIKDRQRALRDLETTKAAITAYEWDTFLVQELVSMAQTYLMYASIEKSLQSDLWNTDDLIELKKLAGPPIDIATRWSKLYENELAASLATIQSPATDWVTGSKFHQLGQAMSRIVKLPSSQLRHLDDMQQISGLVQIDLEQLMKAAQSFERPGRLGVIASILAPSVHSVARAYFNSEEARRLLLAALALKQYKLAQGSYPAKLDQLLGDPTMEVTRAELEGIDHSPLGYKLDGPIAYLWNARPANANNGLGRIATELPEIDSDTGHPRGHFGTVVPLR